MAIFYLTLLVTTLLNLSSGALIDDAEDLYRNLTTVTESTAGVAFQEIWAQSQEVFNEANAIISIATPEIQSEIERIYERYNDVKNYAALRQLNVTECIDLYEGPLNLTLASAFVELTQCVNQGANSLQNYLGQSLANIHNMIEEVYSTGRKLSNCERNEGCLVDVIARITHQMQTIPRRINKEKDDAINLAEVLKPFVAYCGNLALTNVSLEGGDQVDDFETCIDDIINDQTSTSATITPTTTSSDTTTTQIK